MFFKRFSKKKPTMNQDSREFELTLYSDLERNLDNIKQMLDSPSDLEIRRFMIGETKKCAVIFIAGMADKALIQDKVMKSIQQEIDKHDPLKINDNLLDQLKNNIIPVTDAKEIDTLDDLSLSVLSGDTALLVDGESHVLIISSKGFETRSVEEPQTESLIRGPREGFIENLQTNMVLLRRYIRDSNLRFHSYKIGRRSKRDLVLSYIDGIVHPDLVKEAKRRLESIDMDDAPESGYIEQWLEDDFLSPFPQMEHTERPDKVAAGLLQGKVAIFLDGTPFVLLAPFTFGNTLQSPEDYYERWLIGSLIRILRYVAAFIALFLPSLYVALVSYHPGMIPSKLAFSIAATREGVPFPAFVEAILMEVTMELLREAGIRLPKAIGQTIGIVGGLVIGEAAVTAGIVSPIMVIVVAVTAISSFAIPSYSFAISIRVLRFGFMVAAAIFGLYGIILCYIMINIHFANLKSMGVPYSTPFAPSFADDWKDLVFRAPLTLLTKRPVYTKTQDKMSMDKEGEEK